jgi:hypothetical protein
VFCKRFEIRRRIKRSSIRYDTLPRDLFTLYYHHSTQLQHQAIMPKCCIICSVVASPDIMLQYCARCQSALYCSKACQKIDWKQQHKKICKLLNVGHGDMQVRTEEHTSQSIESKEQFEMNERCFDEGDKRFFKLFEESTFEGSQATAQSMTKFAKRQTELHKKVMLYHSVHFLVRSSNSEMLSWPNSPLLVMLQFVDPDMLLGGESSGTLLHNLGDLADPVDYSTHVNQLILAKQLVEHGANVAENKQGMPPPLHIACSSHVVTNLDFVEYLLEVSADPNARDYLGTTPLMYTTPNAPGAAKFLLNWPTTDANITTRSGVSFLAMVRSTITEFSDEISLPDNPDQVQHRFLLQQWRGIEEMLVERGARDTEITAIE